MEIIILSMLLVVTQATPFSITPLDPRKGIYLEKIGRGIIYEQTWTLLTAIEIPDWKPITNYLEYCDSTLLEVCSFRGETAENKCVYWHRVVQRDIGSLKEQVAELSNYSNRIRRRRGLIDAVGKISKFLFGTMDHEDAEKIYDRLQNLEGDVQGNFELIAKQMALIKSNFNAVLGPIKELHEEQKRLRTIVNHFIEEYTENIGNLNKEVRQLQVQMETSEIMLAVITQVQDAQERLNHLFMMINALQQRKMHPLLFKASELRDLYKNLSTYAEPNELMQDPAILQEISTVDHLILDNKILVKIQIPIGKETSSYMAKVHKYPIPMGNHQFALMHTLKDYVIPRNDLTSLKALTKDDFETMCRRITSYTHETTYLCRDKGQRPVGNQTLGDCTTSLLRNHTANNPKCFAKLLGVPPQLLEKMEGQNKWIYSLPEAQLLQAHCRNGTTQHLISGVGILRVNPHCAYTLGAWELIVEKEQITTIEDNSLVNTRIPALIFGREPVFNLTTQLEPLQEWRKQQEHSLDAAMQQTDALVGRIQQLETHRLERRQNDHFWTHISISMLLAIFIVLILVYTWRTSGRASGGTRERQSATRSVPEIVTISAPLNSDRLPPHEMTTGTLSNTDHTTSSEHRVKFCNSTYEVPPTEAAPPIPPTLKRKASIRIPRHAVRHQ